MVLPVAASEGVVVAVCAVTSSRADASVRTADSLMEMVVVVVATVEAAVVAMVVVVVATVVVVEVMEVAADMVAEATVTGEVEVATVAVVAGTVGKEECNHALSNRKHMVVYGYLEDH